MAYYDLKVNVLYQCSVCGTELVVTMEKKGEAYFEATVEPCETCSAGDDE